MRGGGFLTTIHDRSDAPEVPRSGARYHERDALRHVRDGGRAEKVPAVGEEEDKYGDDCNARARE